MKRLTAILLLGIFSFNIFGYRLVASYLENKHNQQLELAFDINDYSDQELISIKQPTNLPYYQNSNSFQRIDGEIEIEGVYYKYVKCRIYNDSLELLCIPNAAKMKIQAARADFSKMASDIQQSTSKKKTQNDSKSKHSISEYEAHASVSLPTITADLASPTIRNIIIQTGLFSKSVEQPPELLA